MDPMAPSDDDLELEPLAANDDVLDWRPWADDGLALALLGSEGSPPLVLLAADTIHDMMGHGTDQTDREVGGVLLGNFVRTEGGMGTRVEDIVPAPATDASLTHVTFTHQSWERIHAALDRRDDHVRIVGWYHTHPGFGPFLSAHDRFIQEHFFSHPLHAALVLDPVKHLLSVFGWREGSIQRLNGCYLYDEGEQAAQVEELCRDFQYVQDQATKRKGLLGLLRGK